MRSLRLALALASLLLSLLQGLMAACDPERQYSYEGLCCEFCPPGHFVKKHCSKSQQTMCDRCPSGTYSEVTDNLDKCRTCTTCQQDTVQKCSATLDAKCSCQEGFHCSSVECSSCQKKVCPPGEKLVKIGAYVFTYRCEPCTDGTYSDTVGGVCKPVAQCKQLGLETIFPGNKTHNSACSLPVLLGPAKVPDKASTNTEAILVAILLLCAFTTFVVLAKACILKAKHRKLKKAVESTKACPATTVDLLDDMLGFHLSKEEGGDCPIQEIDKKPSLTSLVAV